MIFNRVFSMPSADTFLMKPVSELLERYDVGRGWVDPYCGKHSPAELRNDMNPSVDADYNLDALDFCEKIKSKTFKGALFDPPYSYRQVSEHYKHVGRNPTRLDTSANFYARVLDPLSKIILKNGLAISFGWNSSGFGKRRGFEVIEILMLNHGGRHNDTIVVVERKG